MLPREAAEAAGPETPPRAPRSEVDAVKSDKTAPGGATRETEQTATGEAAGEPMHKRTHVPMPTGVAGQELGAGAIDAAIASSALP